MVAHDRVRRLEVRLLEGGPLRPDPHPDADLCGGLCEVRVDLLPKAEPARHRRNHEGGLELLAEECHVRLDVVQVDLGECVVHEPDVVPEVVLRGDVLLEDDVHVFLLPLLRLRRLRHVTDLRGHASLRRVRRAPHPGLGSLRYR